MATCAPTSISVRPMTPARRDAGAAQAYSERLLETPEFLAWERAAQAG